VRFYSGRCQLDNDTVRGIEPAHRVFSLASQVKYNARRAGRSFGNADTSDQSVVDFTRSDAAVIDPRPGAQNVEEEAIGIVRPIGAIFG
jgi:hypothetical protein